MITDRPRAGGAVTLDRCALCGSDRLDYAFHARSGRLEQCRDCGLLFRNPQPPAADPDDVRGLPRREAETVFAALPRHAGPAPGRLLDVGCGPGELLAIARDAGFAVTGVEGSPSAAAVAARIVGADRIHADLARVDPAGPFDAAVLSDVLERASDPVALLTRMHGLLVRGGTLVVTAPSLESWSARLLGVRWTELAGDRRFYFDRSTLESALFKAGFEAISVRRGHAVARARPLRARPRLTIIVPVFNERATFARMMDAVLALPLDGVEKEILVVESYSTDGSREEVLRYGDTPGVTVLLEDRPQGKGHAVRHAFRYATGDFVLIQDADLEYDVNDYPALLRPLLDGRRALVLGSRHLGGGTFKVRQFTRQPVLAFALNGGHWFFAALLNVLYGQTLRDPFTMYKVFRRDCLHGLRFECDRFDFDFELLIKLLRKGYRPLEIPVNYVSRSFAEGKKVSVLRDPWTWLRALVKYRFARLGDR